MQKDQKKAKFEDMLAAFNAGKSEDELAVMFDISRDSVRARLPALELATLKLGLTKNTSPNNSQASNVSSPGSGIIAGPVQPTRTAGTGMVPVANTSTQVPQNPSNIPSNANQEMGEGQEPDSEIEAPPWMKNDGRDMVNTIEMAIRGVNSKDIFSPVTILLQSYLKYLGGPEMAEMTFGDMVDWCVRRLCKEKGINIQIGKNYLPENVRM